MDCNNIPKTLPKHKWWAITNPQLIEEYLIKIDIKHLNKAQGTTCTVPPIHNLLGDNSFTKVF